VQLHLVGVNETDNLSQYFLKRLHC
jgi:hypothetical protein